MLNTTVVLPAPSRPPRRAQRLVVIITGSALAGALVLQAIALAAGGRDLRAGTTGPAIVGLLITAALAAGLGHRWARLRWPANLGMAAAASIATFALASAMLLVGWLAGFYYPNWTVF
jgi:hypothetical protein